VSKIFILGRNEIKPTLTKFMDPKDIPKKYGGELDWNWGDMPHLDDETRAAVEKDGNKGWVRGPCLWLDGKRVPVGTENKVPRRPNIDIDKLKPVVYAADYTEVPVHADRKHSGSSSKPPVTNETAAPHHSAEAAAAAATGGATAASVIAVTSNSEPEAQVPVHTTEDQAAPATSEPTPPGPAATTVHEHPPAQPQAGPVPEHTTAMASAIEEKLAGESVSTIPAKANGVVVNGHATGPNEGHPEVIVASDASKGLAIETDKLKISDSSNKPETLERPAMERFVTAAEV
jgi:hypothetical protein